MMKLINIARDDLNLDLLDGGEAFYTPSCASWPKIL